MAAVCFSDLVLLLRSSSGAATLSTILHICDQLTLLGHAQSLIFGISVVLLLGREEEESDGAAGWLHHNSSLVRSWKLGRNSGVAIRTPEIGGEKK